MSEKLHTPIELSDTDRKILEYIQRDGRASFREIAKELEMSVSTVSKHMEYLQTEGIIKDFIAVVNCCKIGYKEMILLHIKPKTSVSIEQTLRKLEEIPQLNAIYQVSGAQPIFCMAKCVEKEDQIHLLEKIQKIEGIDEITTQIVMQRVKEDMRVPIP